MKLSEKLNAYLQLIRVPNGFTAIADSWAGYVIYTGLSGASFLAFVYLALASFCLYSVGIVLNDRHDYAKDMKHNPHRPLPSGAVGRREAVGLVVLLALIAGMACIALGWMPCMVAGAVFVSIIMYDIVFKSTKLAPVWMGACRMFNMMLGMSAASVRFYEHPEIIISLSMLVYVLLITVASKCEHQRSKGVLVFTALLLWVLLTYGAGVYFNILTQNSGLVFLALWGIISGFLFMYEQRNASVDAYRVLVLFFIFSITVVDAVYTAGVQGVLAGLLILSCLVPTVLFSFRYSGH